jgi:class 3 adenylate cyclase
MSLLDSIKSLLPRKRGAEFRSFTGVGTLWLSDICAFPNACEGMSPEPLIRAMNTSFVSHAQCIHDSGGVVIQSVGDAILAVWEPSQLAPSHAELALATGRKVLRGVPQTNSETGIEFHLRIALATGKMTADWIGGRFQVVGAPYAVAQRLVQMNIPRRSQLLYTSETLDYVAQKEPSEPIGQIKGVSGEDVPVFEFTA